MEVSNLSYTERRNAIKYSSDSRNSRRGGFWQKLQRFKRKLNFKFIFMLPIFVLVAAGVGYYLYTIEFWKVKNVETNSANYQFVGNQINEIKQQSIDQNLLNLSTTEIESSLLNNQFVEFSYVEKRYPSTLFVYLEEVEPQMYFMSVNKIYLIDNDGDIVAERELDENFEITETERLIYTTKQTFKSDLLKQKWLADKESELREDYDEEKEEWEKLQAELMDESESPEADESVPEDDSDFATFEEYVDLEFSNLDNSQLRDYYLQLRSEVRTIIEDRWTSLQKDFVEQKDLPKIKSTVKLDKIYKFDQLVQNNYFEKLRENYSEFMNVEEIIFESPQVIGVKGSGDYLDHEGELKIIVDKDADMRQDMLRLRTLLLELNRTQDNFNTINLVGEKVVVS